MGETNSSNAKMAFHVNREVGLELGSGHHRGTLTQKSDFMSREKRASNWGVGIIEAL